MRRIAVLAALAALLLAGCDDSDAPAPAPTATLPAPTQTSTVPASTSTATATATATATPTSTLTPGPGANIGFFGLLRADNTQLEPIGADAQARPIYARPQGSGFVIVVEARPGIDNRQPASQTLNHDPNDPEVLPDLQIVSSRPLGDGSAAVCDDMLPTFGGVPAVDPPEFDGSQVVANAINDFGCRFVDGTGDTVGRRTNEACILRSDGEYRFADSQSRVQFCALIPVPMAFPHGDTVLTARVLDVNGVAGPPRQIVVRVGE